MKTIKVRIRGDLVRFLSWLENFVMLNVVKTSYYNNPKFEP